MSNSNLFQSNGYLVYYVIEERPENRILVYNKRTDNYFFQSIRDASLTLFKEFSRMNINLYDKADELGYDTEDKKFSLRIFVTDRVEKESILISNITYKPIDKKLIRENGKDYFNIFKKPRLWKKAEERKKKGDIGRDSETINELIFHLAGNEKEGRDHIKKWLAYKLQNPTDKTEISFIFQGVPGTGKGTFDSQVIKPMLEDNSRSINMASLNKSSDNSFMFGNLIVVCEEVINHENRVDMPQILKNLTTDKTITINRMHKTPLFDIPNYSNFIFYSNNQNPLHIEKDDRRYAVFKQSNPLPKELADKIYSGIKKELEDFVVYLLNLEVKREDIIKIPDTKARRNIIQTNLGTLDRFIEDVKENENLIDYGLKIDEDIYNNAIKGEWIKLDILYKIYCTWCLENNVKYPLIKPRFSDNLEHKGFVKMRKEYNDGSNCYSINFLSISDEYVNNIKKNIEQKESGSSSDKQKENNNKTDKEENKKANEPIVEELNEEEVEI